MSLTQDRYRLISADDDVDLSHEQIKESLATKFHQDYDDAVGAFVESMMPMFSASANQLWKKQNYPYPVSSWPHSQDIPPSLRGRDTTRSATICSSATPSACGISERQ